MISNKAITRPKPEGPRRGWGSWGVRGEPPPHQLGVWGRAEASPVGSGAKPRPKPILVHFQACRRHKKSLYYKTRHCWFDSTCIYGASLIQCNTAANLVTNSRSVFVCLIFPWNFVGCSNTPLLTALISNLGLLEIWLVWASNGTVLFSVTCNVFSAVQDN